MQEVPSATVPPTYSAMLKEAGKQIWFRRSLILKRSLLVIWPAFILIPLIEPLVFDFLANRQPTMLILFISVWVPFTIGYFIAMRILFSIEKTIWLDSYFDGKNLDSAVSLKIARRLFLPMIGLWFHLLPKLAKPASSLILSLIFEAIALLSFRKGGPETIFGLSVVFIALLATVLLVVSFAAFIYTSALISLRIRYLTFLFLDYYSPTKFDRAGFWKSLEKLNEVSKSETIKKALATYFGSASLNAVAQAAAASLQSGFELVATIPKNPVIFILLRITGRISRLFGGETAYHVATYGQGVALYLLYRHTREVVFGKPQEVNEAIYRLASKT